MIMRDNTATLTRHCWTTSTPRTRTTTTTRPGTTRNCWTTSTPWTRTTTTACPGTTRTEGTGRKPPLSAANLMQRLEYMDNITATPPRSCWTTSMPWTRTTPTTCPGTTRNCWSTSTPRTRKTTTTCPGTTRTEETGHKPPLDAVNLMQRLERPQTQADEDDVARDAQVPPSPHADRSRSPPGPRSTSPPPLPDEVHRWLEAASQRLDLARNSGGGNGALLRAFKCLVDLRDIDSYRLYAEPFLQWISARVQDPECMVEVQQDREWAEWAEPLLWEGWLSHHQPDPEVIHNRPFVGIFAAVDGILSGQNTYRVLRSLHPDALVPSPVNSEDAPSSGENDSHGRPPGDELEEGGHARHLRPPLPHLPAMRTTGEQKTEKRRM